jgi:alkyl hydroperoxide reductase subunit AhpF
VGGGNAAFETAAQLLAYTKSVTLLNRDEAFKADPVTVEKVLAHENMTAIKNATVTKVSGEKFVHGLQYTNSESGKELDLAVTGIFVEIGMIPNTDFL